MTRVQPLGSGYIVNELTLTALMTPNPRQIKSVDQRKPDKIATVPKYLFLTIKNSARLSV